jgi:hypothetical protein
MDRLPSGLSKPGGGARVRGSRAEWIALTAALAVIVGLSVLLGNRGAEEGQETRQNPSSYNPRGTGSKGLFLWLQALGVRARRWELPLRGLPREAAVLLVMGPRISPVEEDELQALEEWVRGGGVLVLADNTIGLPMPQVWGGAPVASFGLRPTLGGQTAILQPAFPSRYVEGVEGIQPLGPVRFQRQASEGWAPLFADASGDLMGVRRLGRGTLIAISDPGLFSNARLQAAGHARLLLNIVSAHVGRGVLLVDEFHHGHGAHGAFSRYLRGTAVPWMLAQAALAFLAFLVARGTRFGAPVPPVRPARASSLEYVSALGDLYQRARARRLAVEALAGWLRRTLVTTLGAPPGENASRLAGRAARRFRVSEDLVRACLTPGPGAAASDEELLKFARAMHRVEGRLRHQPRTTPRAGRRVAAAPRGQAIHVGERP